MSITSPLTRPNVVEGCKRSALERAVGALGAYRTVDQIRVRIWTFGHYRMSVLLMLMLVIGSKKMRNADISYAEWKG